jgi:hypothetical protein
MAAQELALRQVKRQISATDPHARLKYLRDFTEAFVNYRRVLAPVELEQQYHQADVLLVGDYHALAASQAFTADLVAQLSRDKRPLILALEMVFARDQRLLDRWFLGEVHDDDLRTALRYDAEWGYDWSPFAALLQRAKECGVAVFGIDLGPRGRMRRIGARDRHAAQRIAELRKLYPHARVLALFGEAHLAPTHLPGSLRRLRPHDRVLTILQNVDELYWKAAGESLDNVQAVQVEDNVLCVFNASPLEKYESYRIYIERWRATPSRPDLAPTFYNLVDALLRSLGLEQYYPAAGNHPSTLLEEYPEVQAHAEAQEFERLLLEREVVADERKQLLEKLRQNGCVYVPRRNLLLIERFQMAAAAEEAVRFVQTECRGAGSFQGPWFGSSLEHYFYFDVMERALITFGAKVLLPDFPVMRESDLIALRSRPRDAGEPQSPFATRDFNKLLDFLLLHRQYELQPRRYKQLPELLASGLSCSGTKREFLVQHLGAMLGAELHDAYLAGVLSKSYLRSLFFRKTHLPGVAKKTYFELAKQVRAASPNRTA